jgi:hypothetical protein
MAHYAFLSDSNPPVVTDVIVGRDETEGVDWEAYYAAVRGQRCLRTSYHGRIRKNYAAPGYSYREDIDAFVPPCPGDGWTLDESTATWIQNT